MARTPSIMVYEDGLSHTVGPCSSGELSTVFIGRMEASRTLALKSGLMKV